MALPSCNFESVCKDIHDSSREPNLLIQPLARLNQLDCGKIRETYLRIYGEDLAHLLLESAKTAAPRNGAGSASSQRACVALSMLLLNPHERDAAVAREALERSDCVNYRALVEIFSTRKSSQVLLMQEAYYSRFKRQLQQDIMNIEPSHPYQRILMALSASHKALQADVSQHIAKCDARRLYQTGEGKSWGAVDEAAVLEILSKRSIPQLRLTFSNYRHIYGHSYIHSLKNEKYGEFEEALRVVVKCISNPPKYYAETLYECIKGTTMDKEAMIRVMASRAEMDMNEIQRVFKKKRGMELRDAMCESIPSGGYRELLVALVTRMATHTSASS